MAFKFTKYLLFGTLHKLNKTRQISMVYSHNFGHRDSQNTLQQKPLHQEISEACDKRNDLIKLQDDLTTKVAKCSFKLEQREKKMYLQYIRSCINNLQYQIWPKNIEHPLTRDMFWRGIIFDDSVEFLNSCTVMNFRSAFIKEGFKGEFLLNLILQIYGNFEDLAAINVAPVATKKEYVRYTLCKINVISFDETKVAKQIKGVYFLSSYKPIQN